jgi:hypothetical protein
MGQSTLRDGRAPFRCRGVGARRLAVAAHDCLMPPRKGIGSIFPNPSTEIADLPAPVRASIRVGVAAGRRVSAIAATQTNSETPAAAPGRVLFSL